jgi:hypothetical protein
MFNWFKNIGRPKYPTWDDIPPPNDMEKIGSDMSKVIPFPEIAKTPPMPDAEPPKEKPATTYYRLGITDNNRVSFNMGYSEITLNKMGVDNMIKQLEVFRDQLEDEE